MRPRTRHVIALSCASVLLCTAFMFEPVLRPPPTASVSASQVPDRPAVPLGPGHADWTALFWSHPR